MWGQSPPQVNTDRTWIGLTQPQVSPQTCPHIPDTVPKATPVLAGAWAHHPIQHHPSPSSQKPQIPPNLPQPCSIQTCNPGSFSTALLPCGAVFRKEQTHHSARDKKSDLRNVLLLTLPLTTTPACNTRSGISVQ